MISKSIIRPCFLFTLFFVCRFAIADDWCQWRGPTQNGHASSHNVFPTDPFGLSLVWKKRIGTGYSNVSVARGRLLVPYGDGTDDWLGAFDVQTAEPIWKYRLGKMYPAHDGGHDGPLSTPVSDGEMVFMLGPRGVLSAVRLSDGKLAWNVDLRKKMNSHIPFWGYCTTPAITETLVIVQSTGDSGHGVVAFDKANGNIVWKQPLDQTDYRSPILTEVNGRQQLVACSQQETFGIEVDSGKRTWSKPFQSAMEMTPVPVGDDRLLLTRNSGVELIRIGKSGKTSSLWRSREFRGNYGTPVYHEGCFFGFSGHALTCISAETGRRLWRSREPGGGKGLIVVDGHLVVFGSKGELLVVKATGKAYLERARIRLSEADGYASPIFSDGMIIVRDLSGNVFSVRTSPVGLIANKSSPENEMQKFVSQLENMADKQAAVAEFLASQKSFPILEDNGWVHFVYTGKATDMAVGGSMIAGGEEDAMTRVVGTNFFYRSYKIEAGARWNYNFVVDFEREIPDPRNPRSSYRDGPLSELVTPGWSEPSWADKFAGDNRGRLKTVSFSGGSANVYVPFGYDDNDKRYPLIVVVDGFNWLSDGQARDLLDQLVESGMEPSIVAFASGGGFRELGGAATSTIAKRLSGALIKSVDDNFRTIADRKSRTIVGKRGAAVAAVLTAVKYPEVYGRCIAISYGREDTIRRQTIEGLAANSKGPKPTFSIAWNRYDIRRPLSFDCRTQSRAIAKYLSSNGFDVNRNERVDCSDWRSWRIMLGEAIK